MQISTAEHRAQPWRIHKFTKDFEVEDVWRYRTRGAGPDDFPLMRAAMRATNRHDQQDPVTRVLFDIRWKLGALLKWDSPSESIGGRVDSLRDRLPDDLREAVQSDDPNIPFTPVYELSDECAEELANKTVHTICHLGWVQGEDGDYELRMAALVKPNGRLGKLYMTAIKPIRRLIVYPLLTRRWERAWRDRADLLANTPGSAA